MDWEAAIAISQTASYGCCDCLFLCKCSTCIIIRKKEHEEIPGFLHRNIVTIAGIEFMKNYSIMLFQLILWIEQ